jgi:hypothetical protein
VFSPLVLTVVLAAETLAVTPLDGLGVDPALLVRLDAALARELRALPDVTVVDARGEPACDGEAACLRALGQKLGAARVLAGSLGRADDELNIALKIVTVADTAEPRTVHDNAPLDRAELRLRASVIKLVRPDQFNASGSILAVVPLAGAEIFVDGALRGTTPLFGPVDGLPPGRREVEVRHPDAKAWRGFLDLRFGEPARIELAVVDGALREVVESPPPGEITPQAPASPNVLLWSGVGVAVVGAALGVGAIVAYDATLDAGRRLVEERTQDRQDEYREIAALCGTLTVASVVALAAGGGLIAFSLVE